MFSNNKPNISFNGKMLKIQQQYRHYFTFTRFNETYELVQPIFSIHNLVIGTMYVDIGETMTVLN